MRILKNKFKNTFTNHPKLRLKKTSKVKMKLSDTIDLYNAPSLSDTNATLCGLRMVDVIFLDRVTPHFKCLQSKEEKMCGTLSSYAVEITLKLDCPYYKNVDSSTLRKLFYFAFINKDKVSTNSKKSFRELLKSKTDKYNPNEFKNAQEYVERYISKVKPKFSSEEFLAFSEHVLPELGFPNDSFLQAKLIYCYYPITLESGNGRITIGIILDLASKIIVDRLISRIPITSEMLAQFFDGFLSKLFFKKETILIILKNDSFNFSDLSIKENINENDEES